MAGTSEPSVSGVSLRRLMVFVGACYFLQGIGGNPGLHDQSLTKLLKTSYGFGADATAAFIATLWIPWMVKPLYGLLSDFLPLFGSRRRSYFVVSGLLSAGSYAFLGLDGASPATLKACLVLSAVGFAFSDVLCDAVMVEKGNPLGATDRLQAVQWTASGVAGVLAAVAGGYAAARLPFDATILLAALFPLALAVYAWREVREEPAGTPGEAARAAWTGLKEALRTPPLWAAAGFIFLFQCSPSLGTSLYYHQKDALGFSDELVGRLTGVSNAAFMAGTAVFGLVAKRIRYELLLKLIIISGVASTLLYYLYRDEMSAYVVTAVAGFVYVAAFLGILTMAAKACPKKAEGTVFALLMSLSNMGTRVADVIGGRLYEHPRVGYRGLIAVSAATTAAMWLLLPLVRERKPPPGEAPAG